MNARGSEAVCRAMAGLIADMVQQGKWSARLRGRKVASPHALMTGILHHALWCALSAGGPLQELLEIAEHATAFRELQPFFLPLIFDLVQRADH